MAENVVTPPEGQAPPEPKKKKEKKPRAPKKKADTFYLPVLAEFTFTSAVILFVFVFLVVVSLLVVTGASLLDLVTRASVSMLVMGFLLVMLTRQVSAGVLHASQLELEEAKKQEEARKQEEEALQEDTLSSEDPVGMAFPEEDVLSEVQ